MGYSIPEVRQLVLRTVYKYNIRGERLLDVGGGTGELTIEIAKAVKAREVHIIDIEQQALAKAKEQEFHTYALDASRDYFPFPDDYFDIVTLIETIEHLQDPDHCLIEVKRVLKPGGIFIVTTPNLAWWVNRLALLFGYQPYFSEPSSRINVGKAFRKPSPYKPSGHVRLFTLKALKDLLEYYGFKILIIKGSPGHHHMKITTFS